MENDWIVLQTTPKREYDLAEALKGLAVSAYAPRYQRRINDPYRPRFSPFPLFPSYLFANAESYFGSKARIQQLPLKLRSYVVGSIGTSYIDEMLAQEVEGYVIMKESPEVKLYSDLTDGEEVKVVDGAFAGLQGVFDASRSADERIVILVSLFNNQSTPLQLHRGQVEPLFSF